MIVLNLKLNLKKHIILLKPITMNTLNKQPLWLMIIIFVFCAFVSCTGQQQAETVKIGEQVWMVRNLDVDHFRNGDPIPEVQSLSDWLKAGEEGKPAWCYYQNDTEKGAVYGKLYNWHAVMDPRGLAPEGFHVPGKEEWAALIEAIGGEEGGGKLKEAGTEHWSVPNEGATNETGFTALGTGLRNTRRDFIALTHYGYWWSTTAKDDDTAWYMSLGFSYKETDQYYTDKKSGVAVRCLKD